MATVNLGRIKFVWQGAYNGATAYVADDVVSYNGSSYICILASTGNLPTNTTYWNQMSQAGTNGTNGTDVGTVITTQGDLLYRDASGLQRLGAGTSGQFLKTNGAGANPAWSTVTTKIVNVANTSVNHNINAGNRYRNPYHYSPLDTSISVTNSSNYFLWQISVMINTNNHPTGAVEASEDNSTWVNAYNKKNLNGDAIVQSGATLSWDTSHLGRYPHIGTYNSGANTNQKMMGTTFGLYRPTGTPSTLYFRFRAWSENSTDSLYIGGDTATNNEHGSGVLNSLTVWEIAP